MKIVPFYILSAFLVCLPIGCSTPVQLSKEPDRCPPKKWLVEKIEPDKLVVTYIRMLQGYGSQGRRTSVDIPEHLISKISGSAKDRLNQELMPSFQPGDEIWIYDSPLQDWQYLAGRSGLVILRNGRCISFLDLLVN